MSFETGTVIFPDSFGFCEGVKAADDLLRDVTVIASQMGIQTVFGLHEIVHNRDVTRVHEQRGVKFVDSVGDIPPDSLVVTSAHGVGPETVYALEQKGSTTFDAACPLVIHTHRAAQQARRHGEKILYVCQGKPGETEKLHDEVQGMVGHLDYSIEEGELKYSPVDRHYLELGDELNEGMLSESAKYRIVTQTTLHADACLEFAGVVTDFIRIEQPAAQVNFSQRGYVCRAVADRQRGVEQLVQLRPRRIVVATDPTSKNGIGYVKLAQDLVTEGTTVHAVANEHEAADLGSIDGLTALTASASTPDETTFAIARVLGLNETPAINRESFKLADAKSDTIEQKIMAHLARTAQRGAQIA